MRLFNAFANTLTGTADLDYIFGGAGADVLLGNGGDDYLSGGVGSDLLNGGDGVDLANFAGVALVFSTRPILRRRGSWMPGSG